MHVVEERVAIAELKLLTDLHAQDVGREPVVHQLQGDRLRRGRVAARLCQVHEAVAQPAILADAAKLSRDVLRIEFREQLAIARDYLNLGFNRLAAETFFIAYNKLPKEALESLDLQVADLALDAYQRYRYDEAATLFARAFSKM